MTEDFLAYSINNSTYVRIRDMAYMLSGSPKQFAVGWNGPQNAILITCGSPYRAVGSEMSRNGEASGIARVSGARILVDGDEADISAYSFGGETFYRLRDIGRALDFSVRWNSSRNAVDINTGARYSGAGPEMFTIRDIDPSRPMVAITFDDGPGQYTSSILDILAQNDCVATFFILGMRAASNEEVIRRAYNMGCDIGGHSWSHRDFTRLSEGSISADISSTNQAIESITGEPAMLFRPPYGAMNGTVRRVAGQLGAQVVFWSIDTRDWATRNANSTYNAIINNVRDGDIILCHDSQASTVEAMRRVVPDLIAGGYQLVTVSELMYFSGMTLAPGSVISKVR